MGVFSDREIKAALKSGQIVIDPYLPANVKGSSVDVRLGEWFYVTDSATNQDYYNPFDINSVQDYFKGPLKAISNRDWAEHHNRRPWKNIPLDHPIIVLRPHERILAHTVEFAGIAYEGTTTMQARSTWGRNGIVVCKDAGWGDPGYINRWTMEIQNDNDVSVPLPVGMRVAQLVFYHMAQSDKNYGDGDKYQSKGSIEAIRKTWKPEMMLPQAYNDKITLPDAR
ncbi:MAG TPA: dCTP deaminase [Candidatus Polarisedimenticolaceae bacterium]|nr:dCTP deaminase [Candidatus Polarisedimenticolaceae bacterium]